MIGAVLVLAASAESLTICADRPAKANGTCTVPAGHWQVEVGAVDWTQTKSGGTRTNTTSVGQTLVKFGLDDDSDLELGFSPHIEIESHIAEVSDRVSGIGDVAARYKRRLTDPDAQIQATLIPFIKLPTAHRRLGNGKVEGGLATALSIPTRAGPTITLGPEVDVLADADGHGYHPGLTNLVNVGISPAPRLTLSAELWNAINFDPTDRVYLWSADFAAAYLPTTRLQIDGGANFGLNRATPDAELYVGVSILF